MSVGIAEAWPHDSANLIPSNTWELVAGDVLIACRLHETVSGTDERYRTLDSTALSGEDFANLLESLAPVKEQGTPSIIDDWEMPDEDEPMSVERTKLHAALGDPWSEFEAERGLLLAALKLSVPPTTSGVLQPRNIWPVLRWRQDPDGRIEIKPTDTQTNTSDFAQNLQGASKETRFNSKVAGALVAAALMPGISENWPEVMRLPRGTDRQFMRAAQTPILALMSLKRVLRQLP